MALSDDCRVVAGGFPFADPDGVINAGTVIVYRWDDSRQNWIQDFSVSSGETQTYLDASIDLSADGTKMIVGSSITTNPDRGPPNRFGYFQVYQKIANAGV